MRPDMGKIVIDAYRHDDSWGHPKNQVDRWHRRTRERLLEAPNKVSNSRGKGGTTHLGDRLNPLYRWLDKQVGRRWDDVYSELSHGITGAWTGADHVIGHALQYVERDEIRWIDGWPYHRPYYFSRHDDWSPLERNELFVDANGLIRRPPQKRMSPQEKRQREREKGHRVLMLDARTAAIKLDSTWFIADLVEVPTIETEVIDHYRTKRAGNPVFRKMMTEGLFADAIYKHLRKEEGSLRTDRVFLGPDAWKRRELYGNPRLYAPSIRTMSKKEIKQRIPEDKR